MSHYLYRPRFVVRWSAQNLRFMLNLWNLRPHEPSAFDSRFNGLVCLYVAHAVSVLFALQCETPASDSLRIYWLMLMSSNLDSSLQSCCGALARRLRLNIPHESNLESQIRRTNRALLYAKCSISHCTKQGRQTAMQDQAPRDAVDRTPECKLLRSPQPAGRPPHQSCSTHRSTCTHVVSSATCHLFLQPCARHAEYVGDSLALSAHERRAS